MRYSQSEKMEIIRTVEDSELSVKRILAELDVPRSAFYTWYRRYLEGGYEGLSDCKPSPKRFWNKIPECEKNRVRKIALQRPELTPHELAWHITDIQKYYISESSVYRILKSFDLICSPDYIVLPASVSFRILRNGSTNCGRRISLISMLSDGVGIILRRCWMIFPDISLPGSCSQPCLLKVLKRFWIWH